MYNLSSICFMCLTENQNFTTLCHNDAEYKTTQQVKYVLPELTISELGIPVHICSGCHSALQSFHEFKTKCLDSYNRLKDYIKSKQGTSQDQPMKCAENNNDRLTEQDNDIDFKEETDPLVSLEKRADLKNFSQESINIKEEIIDSDDSIEEEDCHPFQFVKCEVDEEQDGGPSNISRNNMHNESEFFGSSETKEFLCSICNEKFPRNIYLKEHMKTAHADDESAENVVSSIIPERSKGIYEITFNRYESWCAEKKVKNATSEKVLLAYFEELAKTRKPSSLWNYYSMLRCVLSIKKKTDISKYQHLLSFLKRQSKGYKAKKSRIFKRDDIAKFLLEADNEKYLMIKVVFIIGLFGACRREELKDLCIENVIDHKHFFRIVIPNTRTNKAREFFVTAGLVEGVNMVELIREYVALRPKHTSHSRFFIAYRNKKCSVQPVGINTFGSIPKIIATFLKLPNTEEFTGHCFRRSAPSFFAEPEYSNLSK